MELDFREVQATGDASVSVRKGSGAVWILDFCLAR